MKPGFLLPGAADACRKAIRQGVAGLFVLLVALGCQPAGAEQEAQGKELTPPRLSFMEGQASFWRPGAEDWVPARLNTPLAAGDALYTADSANLELQIGARDFVRAGERTQLSLVNQEPDFLQFKVTAGRASFDLRSLPAGRTIELDTPNAVFTIEHTGYYRVEVNGDATHFITRRGGRAVVTPAGGEASSISPSEEVVVIGKDLPRVETYVAPEIDAWDRWNYARTDHYAESMSSRYLPSGVYGAEDLDHYGNWRVVPAYGPVWVPAGVAPGWVPYSTGSWVWDPYYGWTWIDEAPWGWAPYHYGRWVYLDGFWAWAPGPVVVRPVYAPALVAFFGFGHGVSVRIGIGLPGIGWVALGWGEPLVPWWGPAHFVGRPWWGGWGGPRIVNNVVISRTTVVNVTNITYQNTRVTNAIVAVPQDHFGKGTIHDGRIPVPQPGELTPIRGAHPVKPVPASLVAGGGVAVRPPEAVVSRPVVGTRPPREAKLPWRAEVPKAGPAVTAPAPRIIPAPKREAVPPRPPFGSEGGLERQQPPLPPRFEELRGAGGVREAAPERAAPLRKEPAPVRGFEEPRGAGGVREAAPERAAPLRKEPAPVRVAPPERVPSPPPVTVPGGVRERPEPRGLRREEGAPPVTREVRPPVEAHPVERPQREPRALPGEPANRLSPKHAPERPERAR